MDRRVFDDRRRIGTVKTTINMYGERILEGNRSAKKSQMDLPEKSSTRARDLHMAKRDFNRYKESRRASESVKVQAESELSKAKKTVKELAVLIEESNVKVKAQMRVMETLKKSSRHEEKGLDIESGESHQHAEIMRELEHVKQELSKLKLDMASVKEQKSRALKEIESSSSKLLSNMSTVESLRKEIDEANEEQVLVEVARIEALKEFGDIEAQRQKETSKFSFAMEETRKKMKDVTEEIDQSKELESKLAVTLADVNVLQNELKLAKNMDKKVVRNDRLKHLGGSSEKGDELKGSPSLRSITEELEAAKKELASIKEEGFQFMASMDIIRSEHKHVTEETIRLNKAKEKADLTVQNLNSKLLRAKSKLESATAVEEKAKSILSNLSLTLEQLKTEGEVAKKEKQLISEETANIRAEIAKTESQIDLTEERLQSAIQELESVKSSEALALGNLQSLIENTMRSRASASQHSSSITISKYEYEYLTSHAAEAEEIANKKVAAAQAWIEALKASEKEILMNIEMAHREARETRVEEEQEVYRTESSLSASRVVEGELKKCRQKTAAENLQLTLPTKSVRGSGTLTPSRRAKPRNSISPAVRVTLRTTPPSGSFTVRKKKKVPGLAKFFVGKKIDRTQY